MAEILLNDQTAFCACILFEFKLGKSVGEAYKDMCEATQNDKIDYVDFEYWFYRFYNGNFDLEHDRRLDPEPLTFSDLPKETVGEIVEKLDLVSRLKTRKVSRRLRSIVDKQKAHYDYIEIHTEDDEIDFFTGEQEGPPMNITFDDITVNYNYERNGCLIEYGRSEDQFQQKFINGSFLEIALNDLGIVLKKPKFQLKKLRFVFNDNVNEKISKFIESLKTPVDLISLSINGVAEYDAEQIVSMLKPGTLEEIEINCSSSKTNVNQLFKMEQWKQAKQLVFRILPIRFEECLHFDRFHIDVESISLQDVIDLRDILSKSPNFEYCHLYLGNFDGPNLEEIGRVLGEEVFLGFQVQHLHPIPGTNELLDFKIDRNGLSIDRIR